MRGRTKDGFIPYTACTESSGDCFRLSSCLNDCRARARRSADVLDRLTAIEERLSKLEGKAVRRG